MRTPTEILADRRRHARAQVGDFILKAGRRQIEPVSGGPRMTEEPHTRGVVSAIADRLFRDRAV